jgi:prephenate dehydrogenase
MQIINSREYEQGCLRISLPDLESMEKAFGILENEGYRVFKIGKDE